MSNCSHERNSESENCSGETVESVCSECNRKCTRGPDGTEYGHSRGSMVRGGRGDRCPRRPAAVDPNGMHRPVSGTTRKLEEGQHEGQ